MAARSLTFYNCRMPQEYRPGERSRFADTGIHDGPHLFVGKRRIELLVNRNKSSAWLPETSSILPKTPV